MLRHSCRVPGDTRGLRARRHRSSALVLPNQVARVGPCDARRWAMLVPSAAIRNGRRSLAHGRTGENTTPEASGIAALARRMLGTRGAPIRSELEQELRGFVQDLAVRAVFAR